MYSPTIYKFKDHLDVSNAELERKLREELEEDGRVDVKRGCIDKCFNFTLFLVKSRGKPHAWLAFINTLCKIPNPTVNYLNFILIIFEKGKPEYYISTGQFYNKIVDKADNSFGKSIARRIIHIEDLAQISQSCSSGMVTGVTRKLRHANESISRHVENFGRTLNLVKGKGEIPPGREKKRSEKVNWHATSSGGVRVPTDLDDKVKLPEIFALLEKILHRQDRLRLPELEVIKDDNITEQLWAKVFAARKKKDLYFDSLADETFDNYFLRKDKENRALPENIDDYEKVYGTNLDEKTFLLNSEETKPKPGSKIPVKRRLRGTLQHKGQTYYISDGKWHRLNREVLPSLQRVMKGFIFDLKSNYGTLSNDIIQWSKKITEPPYLKKYATASRSKAGWRLVHQKNLDIEGSRIEIADLLKIDEQMKFVSDLFFVKKGNCFHDFSYCCRQLVRSAQILCKESVLDAVNEHLKKHLPKGVKIHRDVRLNVLYRSDEAKSLDSYPAHLLEMQDMVTQSMLQLGFRCAVYIVN